ncbi:carboxyltransferase domain-containing protein [Leucobacter aridicollis]|uniref:5-oxoprolinase subunit B/C family protein n=1 Tax=Leucobacter aridicollis TaxID=283878 RepID=UPI0021028868|nr:carboxyltransferase domain-containing protein [Leucobacter aridicollis]UTX52863.1 carboxyltransferase domain-containing protein [Leucobacter aridicollis]
MTVARPSVKPAGTTAALIDCGSLESALRVFAALAVAREHGELHADELVPAAETVLVLGGAGHDPRALAAALPALLDRSDTAARTQHAGPEVVIPVHYTGPDLAEVASLTGMSEDAVIARHTAASYVVAFTGFAPGFAYLSGGDPALVVPRRETPRPRIQPGAVGLAGQFSGVYPRESPGGWQIIGATSARMWDTEREQPAVLVAGGRVRFTAVREEAKIAAVQASAPTARRAPDENLPAATLRVVDAGLQTLVQDAGRLGAAAMGVGRAGTAIRRSYRLGNALVGNAPGAAALELSHGGFAADALATTVLALTGATRAGRVTGPFGARNVPHGAPFRLSAGERLTLGAAERGLRSILSLRGGIGGDAFLGSRARDTLAELGPAPVAVGDEIRPAGAATYAVGAPTGQDPDLPAPGDVTTLRVILGPRDDWFDAEAVARLTGQSWMVAPQSDRVGVRLAGEPLRRDEAHAGVELPSEGVVLGALQVPPDGQPVLFLADHPLTGGYPVIAVVHDDDVDLAAQLTPGSAVRFTLIADAPRTRTETRQ